jgi:hypothetical protein
MCDSVADKREHRRDREGDDCSQFHPDTHSSQDAWEFGLPAPRLGVSIDRQSWANPRRPLSELPQRPGTMRSYGCEHQQQGPGNDEVAGGVSSSTPAAPPPTQSGSSALR